MSAQNNDFLYSLDVESKHEEAIAGGDGSDTGSQHSHHSNDDGLSFLSRGRQRLDYDVLARHTVEQTLDHRPYDILTT